MVQLLGFLKVVFLKRTKRSQNISILINVVTQVTENLAEFHTEDPFCCILDSFPAVFS